MMRKIRILARHPSLWWDVARALALWPIFALVEWIQREDP